MEEKDTTEELKSEGTTFEETFEETEAPDYDQTIKVFEEGDVVTGHVVRIDRDEILVDVGYKSEGVIPTKELDVRSNARPEDVVKLGEEIDALVLQKEDKDGRLILSRKRAEYEKAWINLDKKHKSGELIEGTVIEVVKGGLILNIGLRGFLPASLVDIRRVKDLTQYLGQKLECRIIEMDRNRNNVVMSRRDALADEQHDKRVKVLKKLKPGDIITGTVSSIVNFGAFVDLGGIDGLIHISELSWEHVNDPHDIVTVNEEIKVKVLDIDFEKERVSLGLKQTLPDPWKEKADKFPRGSVCQGKIIKIVPFGVFVKLDDEIEGLVHVSEISYQHIENPASLYNEGDIVDVKVMDIDYDKHRIKLSIKATEPVPAPEPVAEEEPAEAAEAEQEAVAEPAIEEAAEVTEEAVPQEPETAIEEEKPSEEPAAEPEEPMYEIVAEEEAEVSIEVEASPEAVVEAPVTEEAAEETEAEEPEVEAEVIEEEVASEEPESVEEIPEPEEKEPEEAEKAAEPELKESAEFEEEAEENITGNVSLESILEDMKRKSKPE